MSNANVSSDLLHDVGGCSAVTREATARYFAPPWLLNIARTIMCPMVVAVGWLLLRLSDPSRRLDRQALLADANWGKGNVSSPESTYCRPATLLCSDCTGGYGNVSACQAGGETESVSMRVVGLEAYANKPEALLLSITGI